MNAKTELIGRLLGSFSGGDAITEETLADLLKGYTITRESDETRSDLHRRIKYYLGAKRIDGLCLLHSLPRSRTSSVTS